MPAFPPLDDAAGVAYHLLTALIAVLVPLSGGAAAAAAVVLFTIGVRLILLPLTLRLVAAERARARLAPGLAELRRRHAGDPRRLAEELTALHRAEGAHPLAGCLPAVLQLPCFAVAYRLFSATRIDGHVNALLGYQVFGVALGAPTAAAGWVTLVLFVLLAVVATISARRLRRLGSSPVLSLLPYATVVFALLVPVATSLYLLVSTAWSAAENATLRRARPAELTADTPSVTPAGGGAL
jgi:YidC/Oxa1 family membrane protein insertase